MPGGAIVPVVAPHLTDDVLSRVFGLESLRRKTYYHACVLFNNGGAYRSATRLIPRRPGQ